jgi:hypothetical protein
MNVDHPSAGSVSTRNEVNAKAAKTTTKNQSRGRAERGRGAMLGANSTVKAKMLLGLALEGPRSVQSSGAFLHPWTTHRPRFRRPRAAARDAARRTRPAHGDPGRFGSAPGHTLLPVTTGARSGLRRGTPLFFVRDGQRLMLIASKGGADSPD